MIVCPNCNHQNPDGAIQCEACYTPLPASMACPNCGASVQADASFCGQCGFNLKTTPPTPPVPISPVAEQLVVPGMASEAVVPNPVASQLALEPDIPAVNSVPESIAVEAPEEQVSGNNSEITDPDVVASRAASKDGHTQLQQQTASLLHIQTDTTIELPQTLTVIHLGKPNDRIPPDIDLSGFPNSEIISRIHADIRLEGDMFYIEDVGSSNGTYINNLPLPIGNRHRLRPGDRIAFGKGDKVTFLFQLS